MPVREYGFEKLITWQKARALAKMVYELTETYSSDYRFSLVSQMRRAAISISSNIAEGTSRKTTADKVHFIRMAYGSLLELLNLLILSKDMNQIGEDKYAEIRIAIDELSRLLSGLRNSYLKK